MSDPVRSQLHECLDLLKRGQLTEQKLQSVLDSLPATAKAKRQDILYIQARGNSLDSQVLGMLLVKGGKIDPGSPDPNQWPYQNVLAAMDDGWRVISFPNMAIMMDDSTTFGLGCEFILEKWQ